MRRFFRATLRVLILAAVFLASAMTAMRFAIHGREVSVPKLEGLHDDAAERLAFKNGLDIDVDSRYFSLGVPEGQVLSQLPPAGERVRRGTRVRVALSLGAQKLVVPNVIGNSERAAELNIGRRGLELGTVAVVHLPGYPPDQVVAQSPPANAENVASPKVNVLVTAGADSEADLYITPDFVGHTLDEASKAIAESPMHFGKVSTVKNAGPKPTNGHATMAALPRTPATVLRQTPAAGQKIPAGTPINFEVVR